jgi:hypothetical protein
MAAPVNAMNAEPTIIDSAAPIKTRGEKLEGIAFSFCKAATLLLLVTAIGLQRFALPLLAGATALFYVLAHFSGQSNTRCILKKPIIVASFWTVVAAVSLWRILV